MLVINVGWEANTTRTSAALNEGSLDAFVGYINGHVNEWFRKSAPGLLQDWQATPGGSYMIKAPRFPTPDPGVCDRGAFFDEVTDHAVAAARAAGFEPNLYTIVVFHWTGAFCGFAGMQFERRIALVSMEETPMHELGHYLGLPHAAFAACKDANGSPVPLSDNCAVTETGDLYDLMGRGSGAYNAVFANALGWLNNQSVSVSAGQFTRTWTLQPYTGSPQGLRALRLVDGPTTLWLEYRQPIGVDEPGYNGFYTSVTPGLIIHREVPSPGGGIPTSQLLDMTPTTSDQFSSALPVGQTWANPLGSMKITLDSADASGATVTISSQRFLVPNVVGDELDQAIAAIESSGLTFGGWQFVKDPTCAYIGTVKTQTPFGGDRVVEGTEVRVGIGEEDRAHLCQ